MRQFFFLLCFFIILNIAIAQDKSPHNPQAAIKVTSLAYPDDATHLNMIVVQFANFIYKGSSNLVPEDLALDKTHYNLVQIKNNITNQVEITLIKVTGAEQLVNGQKFCSAITLEGKFEQSTNYNLTITYPDIDPVTSPVLGGTNTWWSTILGPMSFNVSAFEPSGGTGALGVQYVFDVDFNVYNPWKQPELLNSNNASFLKLDFTSKGQFGVNYDSSGSSSNNIQDSLTAELDGKFLENLRLADPSDSSKQLVYPMGAVLSPAGFEWNKELTLGSYTPKTAIGGAIPWLDYPALFVSRWAKLENSFSAPTLFTGVTYVDPLSTNGTASAEASKVRERWDTEFIYDMPLFSWSKIKLNEVAFRFTWDSYIGIDRSLWKYYYQVGTVWYFANAKTTGVFVGYQAGAQPPAYKKVDSWQLGFSLNF